MKNLRLFPVAGIRAHQAFIVVVLWLACVSALQAQVNTISTIDSPAAAAGRYTSVAIGADGFPVISHRDDDNGDLVVSKCNDASCTPGLVSTTAVAQSNNVGFFTSIAIGTDGFPVISYHDDTSDSLQLAKCSNAACTGATTITTVDDSLDDVGEFTSIAIGSDGFPVISYSVTTIDQTSGGWLKVAKCNDAACAGGDEVISTVDNTSVFTGEWTSIAIGADNLPVISYFDRTAGALRIAKCNDAACTGGNETITSVDAFSYLEGGEFTTSIAIGLDTFPVISYHDHAAGSLKVAKCNDSACVGGNETITAVDGPTDDVGAFTSITIGSDGFPVISYHNNIADSLKVAKCNDAACAGGNETITTLDDPANRVGAHTSIAIGADGFPIITHHDSSGGQLKVVKCNDAACSGGDEIYNEIENPPADVGSYNAISIGLDGLPVIAFRDSSRGALNVVKCDDLACSGSGDAATIVDDPLNGVGRYVSIATGTDGFPVISYWDSTADTLKVAKCDDVACAGGNETITTVDDPVTNEVGSHTAIAIGTDGFPVISYRDLTADALKVAKCNDAACAGGDETITTVDDDPVNVLGRYTSIVIGADGFPLISYHDSTNDSLKVVKCNDVACTGGDETITTVDDSVGNVGEHTSIVIGADGFPVIAYLGAAGSLKVARCNDAACSGGDETITAVEDVDDIVNSGVSIKIGSDNFPVISYQADVDDMDGSLKVAKCNDAACSPGNVVITTIDGFPNEISRETSMEIGADGLPVISYHDSGAGTLKVAHCGTLGCTTECGDVYENSGGGGSNDSCPGNAISVGQAQTHSHCDEDWVRFFPVVGYTYRIETGNLVGGADTVMELYENCGAILAINDDGGVGLASKFEWTATSTAPLDVRIFEYAENYESGEGYDISVTSLSGSFTVNKSYSDGNITPVSVTASCTGGGTFAANPLDAAPGSPAVFIYTGFTGNPTCTAVENGQPAGYTKNESDCQNGDPLNGSCTITNTLNADIFTVNKNFIPDSAATVSVTATCSSGTVTNNPQNASEGAPAVFAVSGASPGATCTAVEIGQPAGYTKDETDCQNGDPLNGSCTIANRLNADIFSVNKSYSDSNTTPVTVNLTCNSGAVTALDGKASPGDPAEFRVDGAAPGATCTATESDVPAGYVKNESGCLNVSLSAGNCTIENNLSITPFNVFKEYSDDGTAPVTVNLDCSSGFITILDGQAAPGDPAEFTVGGAAPGAVCTATETGVPAGYSKDESACLNASLSNGSCTLVNTRDESPPADPTGLTACVQTNSFQSVSLGWRDNSVNENGFRIERREIGPDQSGPVPLCNSSDEAPAVSNRLGGWQEIEPGYSPNSTNDSTAFGGALECETNYEFRVAAFNGPGDSSYSNISSVVTGLTVSCIMQGSSGVTSESSFGSEGSGANQFSSPSGAEVDADGNVVIADTQNDRVQVCDPTGSCTTLGDAPRDALAEAPLGAAAGFLAPEDVAIDSQGRIIVADTGNHRIQVCDEGVCTPFGGPGSAAGRFDSPRGVAVDGLDRILVADTGNDRIQRCDRAGSCIVIGGPGSAAGQFRAPVGIAGGYDLSIWVADTDNHRIQKCDGEGNCSTFGGFGTDPGQFDAPTRVGIDLDERLVIADSGNRRVQLCNTGGDCVVLDDQYDDPLGVTIDNNGRIVVVDGASHSVDLLCLVSPEAAFGSEGSRTGEFSNPAGAAMGSGGQVIVADRDNHRIQLCNGQGICSSFGSLGNGVGSFSSPSAVAVDNSGRIIVADTENHRIQICSETGKCTAFGSVGIAPGTFNEPAGVATDGSGGIVVADTGNDRVQLCDELGNCAAFGGSGAGVGQFSSPSGVAVDGLGRIIVADSGNDRIQLCDVGGSCTSFGNSGTGPGQFVGPRGVAVDEDGRIVVADSGSGRVQVCDGAGNCSAYGQTGANAGEFAAPGGVAIAAGGRMVVADTRNHRVQIMRKCAPTNRVFSAGFEE